MFFCVCTERISFIVYGARVVVSTMIVKKKDGYYVKSKDGENLGGPYGSRLAASRRLNQVEFFKRKK